MTGGMFTVVCVPSGQVSGRVSVVCCSISGRVFLVLHDYISPRRGRWYVFEGYSTFSVRAVLVLVFRLIACIAGGGLPVIRDKDPVACHDHVGW